MANINTNFVKEIEKLKLKKDKIKEDKNNILIKYDNEIKEIDEKIKVYNEIVKLKKKTENNINSKLNKLKIE